MAKQPSEMTSAELAQEMWKRSDSLDHLQARAELERRRSRYGGSRDQRSGIGGGRSGRCHCGGLRRLPRLPLKIAKPRRAGDLSPAAG